MRTGLTMSANAAVLSKYGAVQVTTCTPGQLLVMLYDGLFRFLGEAQVALRAKDRARAGERIGRAHSIIELLASTLDPTHAPDLCRNLEGVYLFCMNRVVAANVQQDPARLDEVIRVLTPLREAWREAVSQTAKAPR